MKYITLFLVTIGFFSANAHGQKKYPKKDAYYTENPELEKLAGKWQGVNGEDTFTVVLQFRKKMQMAPHFTDALVGWHQYKEGSKIESSTLEKIGNDKESSMTGFELDPVDLYKGITLGFSDPGRSKNLFSIGLTLVSGKTDEAIWEVLPGDWSEGQYQSNLGGIKRTIPPASKIVTIKRWHLKKLN